MIINYKDKVNILKLWSVELSLVKLKLSDEILEVDSELDISNEEV